MPIPYLEGVSSLLFTKRTETVDHHKGQISFPGGAEDDGDDSSEATALRKHGGRSGLPEEMVDVLGLLHIFTNADWIYHHSRGWMDLRAMWHCRLNNENIGALTVPAEPLCRTLSRRNRPPVRANEMSIEVSPIMCGRNRVGCYGQTVEKQ